MIRVLLIQDAQAPRRGFAALLNQQDDIFVVGELDVESDVPVLAPRHAPDVVLINSDYMVSQILPMLRELKAISPSCYVLILSDPDKRGMLPPRRRIRGLSFLVRGTPVPLLAQAIHRVARGELVIDPRLEVASIGTEKAVSTREWEILGLVAQGESVADIARRLYLSLGTVRNHLSAVIMKTGARNRIDAIRIARKDGWLK